MRRAARQDANHAAIVKALEMIGAGVVDTSGVGGGFPDVLVGFRGRWMLLEIKDGSKPPSRRALTNDQERWHHLHSSLGPVAVVKSVEEALQAVCHAQ